MMRRFTKDHRNEERREQLMNARRNEERAAVEPSLQGEGADSRTFSRCQMLRVAGGALAGLGIAGGALAGAAGFRPDGTNEALALGKKVVSDTDVARNIIRAWKDEEYRHSLPAHLRELLPENPAGLVDLIGAELDGGPPVAILPNTLATRCSDGWRCL
jgi:mersacidin/lichenicidin family type 2 lantibiotic